MKELKFVPGNAPVMQQPLPKFEDAQLEQHGYESRQQLVDQMFDFQLKWNGIGLTCNQVGLPINMFTLGGVAELEGGRRLACFNPEITKVSKVQVMIEEGCLTFPGLYLKLSRPADIQVKFEDEKGDTQEIMLTGMMSRAYQHEWDHTQGRIFIQRASKLKLDRAMKRQTKIMQKYARTQAEA